ncbi:PHP domain-containing protein, partial [Vibrio diabolicus]
PPIVKKVAELGMPAMALTDFTNLCGLVKFYGTAHSSGVKPIIGADFKMQSDEFGEELTQVTLLAADNVGYKNLTLLISKAYLRGHVQHHPVIDKAWLAEMSEGLIVLSGGKSGEIGRGLLKGNRQIVQGCVDFYKQHFPDRFYLELLRTGRPDEETYLHFAVELAEQQDLPVVATNEVV